MLPSPPQYTFRDTYVWRIVAGLPFAALLAWGIYDYSASHSFDVVLWSFIAVSAALFAFACGWAAAKRISIHAEGVAYKSMLGEKDLRWEEITETRYVQQPVNAGAHFGLIGLLVSALATRGKGGGAANRTFKIIGRTQRISLNSNVRDVQEAIRLVLAAVNPRFRQEAERALNSGRAVSFGNISLSPAGVIWKSKEAIPYNAIKVCRLDGAMLRIKAEGKWLDNIATNSGKVPNVFVLLDIIDERRAASGQGVGAVLAGSSAGQYV